MPKTISWNTSPAMQIDVAKTYKAVFDTSFGSFEIELFADESPVTVNNFVFLARQNFYNGTIFHRVIKEFMIQGGNRGQGSPGYAIADELPPKHPWEPGIIAMANKGEPNSGSCQFFICTGYQAALNLDVNPTYTQFGRVVSGMDVVRKIASVPVVYDARGEQSVPLNPPVLNSVTIIES